MKARSLAALASHVLVFVAGLRIGEMGAEAGAWPAVALIVAVVFHVLREHL